MQFNPAVDRAYLDFLVPTRNCLVLYIVQQGCATEHKTDFGGATDLEMALYLKQLSRYSGERIPTWRQGGVFPEVFDGTELLDFSHRNAAQSDPFGKCPQS